MKVCYRYLFIVVLFCIVGWGPFTFSSHYSNNADWGSSDWVNNEMRAINSQADNLDTSVLKLSLNAYVKARELGLNRKPLLTIVDYSKPSTERRLWVIDLNHSRVLFNTWVAHGVNSGEINASSFSNQFDSLKSSLGVFLTRETYQGQDGYSLHLQGLEPGINDNAYQRHVIFHGAWYADANVVKKYGMLGRSWGCLAVSPNIARSLINTIKNRSLVVAYYPDRNWINHSAFLHTI